MISIHYPRTIADLKPGDHLCCLYETEDERRALLTPYLRQGLERGEKVLYIVDAHTIEVVQGYLRDDGLEVEPYQASGQLSILTVDDAYMREGIFDADGMIALLRSETDRALAEGYAAQRVTSEMTWVLRGLPGSERFIEYESKLNTFLPGSRCQAICQYDRRRFDPAVLLDVLATHPIIAVGTDLYDNFYYIPTTEFLGLDRPGATLRRWLDNLAERKEAEEALRDSEQKYRTLLDNIPQRVFYKDRNSVYLAVNPSYARDLGRMPDEVVGKTDYDLFPPEMADKYRSDDRRIIETATSEEIDEPYPLGGEVRVVHTLKAPVRASDGAITGVLGIFWDITERKRAEEERERLLADLQRWAAELDTTITSIADGVLIYDPRGEIVRMNPAAERILGYSPEQRELPLAERMRLLCIETLDGKPFPPEEQPAVRAFRGERAWGVVMVIRLPDGRAIWVSSSGAPIRLPSGDLLGAVVTLTDITVQHQLQEQREDLLRAVSHDLRAPLTIILGQAQLLGGMLEKAGLTGPERRSAEAVVTGAKRMNVMIQDLVDSVRLEAGQLRLEKRPVELRSFVSDLLERSVGVIEIGRVRVEIPPNLPPVSADANRLERILTNLLSNALKYSSPDTEVKVTAKATDGEVVVSVADRGVGIAPEDLPHMFERYYRAKAARKTEGLGLGLYISRMLVGAHGGRIWAESQPGKGSTFSFTLPVA